MRMKFQHQFVAELSTLLINFQNAFFLQCSYIVHNDFYYKIYNSSKERLYFIVTNDNSTYYYSVTNWIYLNGNDMCKRCPRQLFRIVEITIFFSVFAICTTHTSRISPQTAQPHAVTPRLRLYRQPRHSSCFPSAFFLRHSVRTFFFSHYPLETDGDNLTSLAARQPGRGD